MIHYHGFDPELFNLNEDPEESINRASDSKCADILNDMYRELRAICDPDAVNDLAFADQDKLIEKHGGREKAALVGAPAATPAPTK